MSITTKAAPMVCPECESDESLYSVEKAEIMFPIRVFGTDADDVDYTGDDRIVLDEGTAFDDTIYCRGCSTELTLAKLVEPTGSDES